MSRADKQQTTEKLVNTPYKSDRKAKRVEEKLKRIGYDHDQSTLNNSLEMLLLIKLETTSYLLLPESFLAIEREKEITRQFPVDHCDSCTFEGIILKIG